MKLAFEIRAEEREAKAQHFSVFDDFKQFALSQISKQEATEDALFQNLTKRIGRPISHSQRGAFIKGLDVLEAGDLIPFASKLIADYHSGDEGLVNLMLTTVLRVGFSSPSASLCHIATNGKSGSGKTDLQSCVAALLPSSRVETLNSISPLVLYYETLNEDGLSDPDRFKGKIVILNEANATKGSNESLKALAEMSETATFTHRVTVGGKSRDLNIKGARSVLCASVVPIKDSQCAARFMPLNVEKETDLARVNKARLSAANSMAGRTIETDPRTKIVQGAFELILADETPFEEPDDTSQALVTRRSEEMALAGVGTRMIKMFWSLCLCVAASQSYARGFRKVEVEDVEATFSLLKPWL
jgi:hypothetical protein